MLGGVSDFATKIAKETTESDDENKKDDAASGDFDNCSLGDVARGLFYRAVGFGDLIQVFKAIHKHIITYWFACFKATNNFSGHVRAGLSLQAACSLYPAPVVRRRASSAGVVSEEVELALLLRVEACGTESEGAVALGRGQDAVVYGVAGEGDLA